MNQSSNVNDSDEIPYEATMPPEASPWKYELQTAAILILAYTHVAAIYGLYLAFVSAMWSTILFAILGHVLAALGITAGAHRLWSHRAYKATTPLQIFLMLCQSLSYQNTVAHWARNHRLHHKYTDTDADPHNSSRGFFFSHFGWLLVKRHPEVIEKGKLLDVTDLNSNAVLQFQKRHKLWLLPTVTFILPTVIPMYFWHESLLNAWHLNTLRLTYLFNLTFLFNSAVHKWGYKPYDQSISASQNNVLSIFSLGEGFHNYHHVFPWDYRSTELNSKLFGFYAFFIDVCAYFGLAYDLRVASAAVVKARAGRTGDGTDVWGNRREVKDSL